MKGKGLLKGMKITWQHFWGKKETVMYPEEKLTMTERFRGGTLDLNIDKCISCKLCAIACPNKALSLKVSIDEQKKRHLEEYIYHSGKCLMCDLCIEACPTKAIEWDKNYEMFSYHRNSLDHDCKAVAEQKKAKADAQGVKSDE